MSGFCGMKNIKNKISELLKRRPVRYFLSSCAAFAINYAVLLALEWLLRGRSGLSMELAAIPAFILSSQVNFWINRRWVFCSDKAALPELAGYYSLALFSFLVKTYLLLEFGVRVLRLPLAVASPISEAVMFLINYAVQKTVIFRRRKR